jgi:hypothetical protein
MPKPIGNRISNASARPNTKQHDALNGFWLSKATPQIISPDADYSDLNYSANDMEAYCHAEIAEKDVQ